MDKKAGSDSDKKFYLKDVMELVENLHLNHPLTENDAEVIFNMLDAEKQGFIHYQEFITKVINKTRFDDSSEYSEFYFKTLNYLFTPSQRIIKTVQKAISKLDKDIEKETIQELEWVIQTLNKKDLFDFSLKKEVMENTELKDNDIINFLSEYSSENETRLMYQDIESVNRIGNKKKGSTTNIENLKKREQEITQMFSNTKIEHLKLIDEQEFDIFAFEKEVGREFVLPLVGKYLLSNEMFLDLIDTKKLESFLLKVRMNYLSNPYHNAIHAADVMQTAHIFLLKGKINEMIQMTNLDTLAYLVSALLHDLNHPGLNNMYQINSMSKHAMRYNDKSVLENYHLYEGFKILSNPNSNILANLEKEEFRIFRKRMIENIIATDMSYHFKVYSTFKSKVENTTVVSGEPILTSIVKGDNPVSKFDIQQDIMNFLIHTADISNPAKDFKICKMWADLCMEEFFHQGDLEKTEGLPISFLCDRTTVNKPKAQIGFMNGIVSPLFVMLSNTVPDLSYFYKNIEVNLDEWKRENEKELKEEHKPDK